MHRWFIISRIMMKFRVFFKNRHYRIIKHKENSSKKFENSKKHLTTGIFRCIFPRRKIALHRYFYLEVFKNL